jgi:AcrR family transcriptional regulator
MLDAARDCVLAVGVRRTTMTDVARRAGVSRMTLYRRWPDVRTLVGDLMTREWVAVALGASAELPEPSAHPARAALVGALVDGVRAVRAHPLFRKILDVDPEMLLPYVLDRRGASQDAMLDALTEQLRRGHADGTIRAGHPVRQARTVLLVLQSFALSLRTMSDATDPELADEAFLEELRHLLERSLTP